MCNNHNTKLSRQYKDNTFNSQLKQDKLISNNQLKQDKLWFQLNLESLKRDKWSHKKEFWFNLNNWCNQEESSFNKFHNRLSSKFSTFQFNISLLNRRRLLVITQKSWNL
jgi:hypothetical protein